MVIVNTYINVKVTGVVIVGTNIAIYDTIFRDYGKVILTLKEKLEEEHISRYKLSSLSDTKYEVITKYYNGTVKRVDLDILARICFVLNCEISDILKYERPSVGDND